VRNDLTSGLRSGVNGTPTFFINGIRDVGGYDYGSLLRHPTRIDAGALSDEVERRSNYASIPPADLADISATTREELVGDDDALGAKVTVGSVVGCVVAVGMAFQLAVHDFSPLPVAIISVLCGFVVGGITRVVLHRRVSQGHVRGLDKLSEAKGLLNLSGKLMAVMAANPANRRLVDDR
jgi:hypothetical protein